MKSNIDTTKMKVTYDATEIAKQQSLLFLTFKPRRV